MYYRGYLAHLGRKQPTQQDKSKGRKAAALFALYLGAKTRALGISERPGGKLHAHGGISSMLLVEMRGELRLPHPPAPRQYELQGVHSVALAREGAPAPTHPAVVAAHHIGPSLQARAKKKQEARLLDGGSTTLVGTPAGAKPGSRVQKPDALKQRVDKAALRGARLYEMKAGSTAACELSCSLEVCSLQPEKKKKERESEREGAGEDLKSKLNLTHRRRVVRSAKQCRA